MTSLAPILIQALWWQL